MPRDRWNRELQEKIYVKARVWNVWARFQNQWFQLSSRRQRNGVTELWQYHDAVYLRGRLGKFHLRRRGEQGSLGQGSSENLKTIQAAKW